MMPKWFPKWRYFYDGGRPFWDLFSGLVFSGCQGFPRDPKLTILAPKIDPQSSQNGAQEPPIATQSYSKHIFKIDRCLKAEFESRGSFQKRSTSKRCCGGVPRSVLNPPQHPPGAVSACKIRCHYLINLPYVPLGSSSPLPSLATPLAPTRSPRFSKNRSKIDFDF